MTRTAMHATLGVVVASVAITALTGSPASTLQDAIDQVSLGNCGGAMKTLSALAAGPTRPVAARAMFYTAVCEEKAGLGAAWRTYRELVHDFADQPDVAAAARARLIKRGYSTGGSRRALPIIQVIGEISLPRTAFDLLMPDASEIWVSDYEMDTVSIVDARSWRVRRVIAVGRKPAHEVMSPDGSTIYVTLDSGGICAIQRATGKITQLRTVGTVRSLAIIPLTGQIFMSSCFDGLHEFNPASGLMRLVYKAYCPYTLGAA